MKKTEEKLTDLDDGGKEKMTEQPRSIRGQPYTWRWHLLPRTQRARIAAQEINPWVQGEEENVTNRLY